MKRDFGFGGVPAAMLVVGSTIPVEKHPSKGWEIKASKQVDYGGAYKNLKETQEKGNINAEDLRR